jgi:hypothetical protein
VKRAYVFGSFARNSQDSESDLDIMVELDPNVGVYKLVAIQMALEEALRKRIDLISAQGISKHILPSIEKDKRLVYER